jgi:hypothetical protein
MELIPNESEEIGVMLENLHLFLSGTVILLGRFFAAFLIVGRAGLHGS